MMLQTQIHVEKMAIMADILFKTCRKFSLTMAFMLFLQYNHGQTNFTGVTAILKQNEKSLNKDFVLVVNKEGKNIFLRESEGMKLKTPIPLEATSSIFTAALVIIMAEEGKINMNDPVAKYVPIFEKYMKGYITIAHCINHTTGLDVDPTGIVKFAQKNKFEKLEDEVNYFATNKLIIDNPGQAFAHSTVGLKIAGRVLEIATKKKFDRLMAEKIFLPMGMRTANFLNKNGGAIDPAAGANCSALDLINFMQMIINKGQFMGKRIMSEAAVEKLLEVQDAGIRKRYVPDMLDGFSFASGCWIMDEDNNTNKVYVIPNLMGAWPWFDVKKNYAALLLPKEPNAKDTKKDIFVEIKQEIEKSLQ